MVRCSICGLDVLIKWLIGSTRIVDESKQHCTESMHLYALNRPIQTHSETCNEDDFTVSVILKVLQDCFSPTKLLALLNI